MKHLNSILSGFQSVAKLTRLFLVLACTLAAADAPSSFAPIVGVWPTHFANGVSRVYRISDDGTVTYEQQEPAETKSSKLTVINGESVADFGDRLMGFYKVSEDVMNVAIFGSKEKLDEHKPNVTGKGYRSTPSAPNDPIIGTWKWLLDEQRKMDGVVEFRADGTFAMVGTEKIGTWKLGGNRSYLLNWISIGSEDTVALSADGNGLAGKNKSGRLIFGERMQTVAANIVAPTTPVPALVTTPMPAAPPIAVEPKPIIHSVDEILASADTTKPFNPYDLVDMKLLGQINRALFVNRGREIDLSFQPQAAAIRGSETQFRWQSDNVQSGTNQFRTFITVRIPVELVPAALKIGPGQSAKVRGVVESAAVSYGSGPTLYVSIQATSINSGNHEVAAAGNAANAPAPAGTTATATSITTAPQKSIQLDKAWDTPMQGGTATINDLGRLFGTLAKPNVDLSATTEAAIYDQIAYLMPVRQAIESLKLNVRLPSKVLIACPGLPRDSFYYYAIDGRFEGEYNRMYLVVDRADQVVSVELVDESTKKSPVTGKGDQGWHTYDFVNARAKALNTLIVDQKIALWATDRYEENHRFDAVAPEITPKNAGWRVARVDSFLVEVDRHGFRTNAKQQTRWYVPRQIAELILTCVQKAGNR